MATQPLKTSYQDSLKLFPDFWNKVGFVFFAIFLISFPFIADARWLTVGNLTMVSIVGSLGLMVLTGFTGQISLGHAAFLGLGAYTAAILSEQAGIPFWLTIPLAGVVATAAGLLVGPFALRLEGLYLAIVTIGFLYLVNHCLHSFPQYTHGVQGIAVPMHSWFVAKAELKALGSVNMNSEFLGLKLGFEQKIYFLFTTIALFTIWIVTNIKRSNTGRAMMAVRDHDLAASVLGVSPSKYKIIAFGISSFFGGIAGAMFAYQQQYITIEPPFDLIMSVQYIAMIILGGVGTVFGGVWGAVVFVTLSPFSETIGQYIPFLNKLSSAQQSTLIFSSLVAIFLIFEPLGLFGIWLRIKRYFLAWPFRY